MNLAYALTLVDAGACVHNFGLICLRSSLFNEQSWVKSVI